MITKSHWQLPLLLSVLLPRTAPAVTDTERELQKLTEERSRAVTSALQPINRRYQLALELLLRRATQAGELEAALKIKDALNTLETNSVALAPNADAVIGIWKLDVAGRRTWKVEIKRDGTTFFNDNPSGKWSISGKTLRFSHDAAPDHEDRFDLPPAGGKMTGKNSKGEALTATRERE